MSTLIDDMFRPQSLGARGGPRWNEELFKRAYWENDGPFARVCARLRLGYSVLAYLPGNCMNAAAAIVKSDPRNTFAWTEYSTTPREKKRTLEDVFRATPSLGQILGNWFTAKSGAPPAGIFHNLDFLCDGHGGVSTYPYALTALAGLVAGSRKGVVLGMSDRDEPPVANAVSRAFTEQIRIDEIPFPNFQRLIPVALGEKLQSWNALTDGTLWLLASRLRWTDPVRVAAILSEAHKDQNNVDGVFQSIVKATQTVSFERAADVYAGARPTGVSEQVLSTLEDNLINPYLQWQRFKGDRQTYTRALNKLPPGAILHGPPGTGKTHMARWIAGTIGLPVRVVTGGELRAAGWGDAERNVNRLFRELRRAAPCVLVLDDADDLLAERAKAQGGLASAEVAVVEEFLRQLDGFYGQLEGVVVILTTNRMGAIDAVRTRLPVHVRVPYPEPEQVASIITRVADEYNFTLTPPVFDQLVKRLSSPIGVNPGPAATADFGYFSPREIQQAMRMLDRWQGSPGGKVTPSDEDVQRMIRRYQG